MYMIAGGLLVSIAVLWIVLAVAVFIARPGNATRTEVVSFVPKLARLVWNLAKDRSLPRSARWRLGFAFVYNVQPINLIPDFIPVIGFVDNAVVLAWALRSTVRLAGPDAVARHWAGTPEELDALYRIIRVKPAAAATD
jgi:uncharacterized membrane protein YkvA (DUF1232 family)